MHVSNFIFDTVYYIINSMTVDVNLEKYCVDPESLWNQQCKNWEHWLSEYLPTQKYETYPKMKPYSNYVYL